MRVSVLCLAALALTACPPSPTPPPPDANDGAPAPTFRDASTAAMAACANLAAIGCDEGSAPTCAATFDKLIANPQVARVDLPCLTAATSKAAVRACGLVTCP